MATEFPKTVAGFRLTKRLRRACVRYRVDSLTDIEQVVYALILDTAMRREGPSPWKTFLTGIGQALVFLLPFLLLGLLVFLFKDQGPIDQQGLVGMAVGLTALLLLVGSVIAIPGMILYGLKTILTWWWPRFKFLYRRRIPIVGRKRLDAIRLGQGISIGNSGRAVVLLLVTLMVHLPFADAGLSHLPGKERDFEALALVVGDNVLRGVLFDTMESFSLRIGEEPRLSLRLAATFYGLRLTIVTLLLMIGVPIGIVWRRGLFSPSLYRHDRTHTHEQVAERLCAAVTSVRLLPVGLFLQMVAAYFRRDHAEVNRLIELYPFLPIDNDLKELLCDSRFHADEAEVILPR